MFPLTSSQLQYMSLSLYNQDAAEHRPNIEWMNEQAHGTWEFKTEWSSQLCPQEAHNHPGDIKQGTTMKMNIIKSRVILSPTEVKNYVDSNKRHANRQGHWGKSLGVVAWAKPGEMYQLPTHQVREGCSRPREQALVWCRARALLREGLGSSLKSATYKMDGCLCVNCSFLWTPVYLAIGRKVTATLNGLLY